MKLAFLIEKLESSSVFEEYKQENPSAFLCAGFFILDLDSGNNQYQLDYFSGKEITTFSLGEEILAKKAECIENCAPKKLSEDIKVDISEMEEEAKTQAKNNGLKLNKIIAILQPSGDKPIWNLNCMSGLNILRIKIDANSGDVLKSEAKSLFELGK